MVGPACQSRGTWGQDDKIKNRFQSTWAPPFFFFFSVYTSMFRKTTPDPVSPTPFSASAPSPADGTYLQGGDNKR